MFSKAWERVKNGSPDYLTEKYGREEVTIEPTEEKPVQTKWTSGFIHGDSFETQKVVIDKGLLPQVRAKVTMGPKGSELRDFLKRLEATMADASKSGDRVLIMIFSHGDYDSAGGLCIGIDVTSTFEDDRLLKPSHMASIFLKYPNVKITIYMTSCYSDHWVETMEFQGRDLKQVILAAAEKEEDSFGYAWSHSQRHAGGLFSSTTVSETAKILLLDENASREYRELTATLVAEMHRLCLPVNIRDGYGSSPVITDPKSQEKFWRRTGYRLHHYKENYNKLPTSDPRPKVDGKWFKAGCVDANDPKILSWKERHPMVLDEDFPMATGSYGRTRRGLLSSYTMNYLIRQYL